MLRKRVLSLQVSIGAYEEFIAAIVGMATAGTQAYVCVANVHMTIEAHDDPAFAKVVNDAAIVTPDGMPLAWGLRAFYGIRQPRVAGMDLMPDLLRAAETAGIRVILVGGSEKTIQAVKAKIQSDYPALVLVGAVSPPFGPMADDVSLPIVKEINETGAQLVMVALGCPKQEKWMATYYRHTSCVMVGLGGAFPVFAGTTGRAPRWMQRLSLEWLYRLAAEPGRLWKRYLYTNSKFVWLFVGKWLRLIKY